MGLLVWLLLELWASNSRGFLFGYCFDYGWIPPGFLFGYCFDYGWVPQGFLFGYCFDYEWVPQGLLVWLLFQLLLSTTGFSCLTTVSTRRVPLGLLVWLLLQLWASNPWGFLFVTVLTMTEYPWASSLATVSTERVPLGLLAWLLFRLLAGTLGLLVWLQFWLLASTPGASCFATVVTMVASCLVTFAPYLCCFLKVRSKLNAVPAPRSVEIDNPSILTAEDSVEEWMVTELCDQWRQVLESPAVQGIQVTPSTVVSERRW